MHAHRCKISRISGPLDQSVDFMYQRALVGVVALIATFSAAVAWQNNWDGDLRVECPNQYAFNHVLSQHDNHREDRQWQFYCTQVTAIPFYSCYWSGYVNDFDQLLNFKCKHNYVMTGVQSYHDNKREDRRWQYKCCSATGYQTKLCSHSGYINQWDDYMNYYARQGYVFTGAYSFHDNHREDRLWKMHECQYSR